MLSSSKNRIFVIGLDGATFDIINPLVGQGRLPNIAKMMALGSFGILQSTIPPCTGPAWSSFMTGQNPGKHSLFNFYRPLRGSLIRTLCSYNDIRGPKIWEVANSAGKKVCVVNIPLTYPPPSVDGVFVSGMMTPSINKKMIHPQNLFSELKELFDGYQLDVKWSDEFYSTEEGLLQFLQESLKMTEQRERLTLELIRRVDWDFAMVVFEATDRLQHRMWCYFDPAGKQANPYEKKIIQIFERIDEAIGNLMKAVPKETNFLILSDHGFGPVRKVIYLNNWLKKHGLLAAASKGSRFKSSSRMAAKRFVQKIDFLELRKKLLPSKVVNTLGAVRGFIDDIDWSKTVAYSGNTNDHGIFINLKNREPCGIIYKGSEYDQVRERVAQCLLQLLDESTGKKVFKNIHKREDIYSGPYLEYAPDLIFEFNDPSYTVNPEITEDDLFFALPSLETGYHRKEGILIAKGEIFRQKVNNLDASIVDIAPTILYSLGLPIPKEMDGQIVTELFRKEFLEGNSPEFTEFTEPEVGSKETYSQEEDKEIKERLRSLGYLN